MWYVFGGSVFHFVKLCTDEKYFQVKERDKQLCNEKTDVDEDDDFFETDDLNEEEIDEEIDDEELEEDDEELIEDSKITPEYSVSLEIST